MKISILRALSVALIITVFSCSKEDPSTTLPDTEAVALDQNEPLTIPEINRIIENEIELNGDFDWNAVPELVLWSALQHADGVLTVGYGKDKDDFTINDSGRQTSSKLAIVEMVRTLEGKGRSTTDKDEDILIYEDEYLTVIDLKVLQRETIASLRRNADIRYMEPSGYSYFQTVTEKSALSDSGCGFDTEDISSNDYTTISPNARMPWNFPLHHIDDAWALSTGTGITIGVVDTGLSPNQPLLNANFNNGDSSGRTVEKYGVYVDSFWPWSRKTDGPNDKCGHGTSMSAAATAPRNNTGLPVGVAYNSNLISYRASSDVLLNGYQEQKGVAKAITDLGRRNDVHIISMSMGYIYSINRIKDAIRYAYSRDKLIFCAGGTSTSFTNFLGVVFPASMSETVAVTGIEEGSGYDECDACHKGSTIDFTIIMERGNNNHIPVLGYYSGSEDYVGGSSVATANAAGIAALVWSKNPSWSRNDVLNKLKISAELYPNRSSSYGWGNLDALKAVQ
ncbi:serine protease [Aggregatimonas sangjinii]|uniref:Serine protease n=1 Tax=Aggregatimonas sangjinii TaxID=2583587 RepID=A0A5B7STZ9_9FLAO|nr:S8 family serine peptidase [Aggregatimonas sangjinii]QCX00819.1 serine protease [Aggregatimonas sangjinii]